MAALDTWPNQKHSETYLVVRAAAVFLRRKGGRPMPQLHLPMFPNAVIHITDQLAVMKKDGAVTYFNGHRPVFSHAEKRRQHFSNDYQSILCQRLCQTKRHHSGFWRDVDQRQTVGEDLSRERTERVTGFSRTDTFPSMADRRGSHSVIG